MISRYSQVIESFSDSGNELQPSLEMFYQTGLVNYSIIFTSYLWVSCKTSDCLFWFHVVCQNTRKSEFNVLIGLCDTSPVPSTEFNVLIGLCTVLCTVPSSPADCQQSTKSALSNLCLEFLHKIVILHPNTTINSLTCRCQQLEVELPVQNQKIYLSNPKWLRQNCCQNVQSIMLSHSCEAVQLTCHNKHHFLAPTNQQDDILRRDLTDLLSLRVLLRTFSPISQQQVLRIHKAMER